jgi:vacuolar-type H+-ATPase subunit H
LCIDISLEQKMSAVEDIINALSELENDIDNLNAKAEEMRRHLMTYSNEEIEKLKQQVINAANDEAKRIMEIAKSEAEQESSMTSKETDKTLSDIKKNIDSSFNKAVENIVKIILGEPVSSTSITNPNITNKQV